jgi:succinate dehydrogenase cytochrome b subunit
MNKTLTFFKSSVGKKIIMSLTGFFLFSFLIVHLYINLFLFKQDQGTMFDTYAEFMATYPLLRPLEIILFAGFLIHGFVGVWLWLTNRAVRPEKYKVHHASETSTVTSRITFWTGMFVALFLVVHVNTFFVKSRFFPDGRPMYDLVAEAFRNPINDLFYLIALVFLGYHLKHGFQSALQTLGLLNTRYKLIIDAIGVFFWLVIPVCFAVMPLYFLFGQ